MPPRAFQTAALVPAVEYVLHYAAQRAGALGGKYPELAARAQHVQRRIYGYGIAARGLLYYLGIAFAYDEGPHEYGTLE